MKHISKFSEAAPLKTQKSSSKYISSKDYIEPMRLAFVDIRNILVDFEDMNIIRYHVPGSDLRFDPSGSDDSNSTSDLSYYIPYTVIVSRSFDTINLNCYIDIPCNENGSYLNEDIDILEDVIVCVKRLNSSGYKSTLNFSKNNNDIRSAIINVLISL